MGKQNRIPTFVITAPHFAAAAAHKCQVIIFHRSNIMRNIAKDVCEPTSEGQVRSELMTVLSVGKGGFRTVIPLFTRMSLHKHKAGK